MYYKEYVPVGHVYWIKGGTTLDEIKKGEGYMFLKVFLIQTKYFLNRFLGDDVEVVSTDSLLDTLKSSECDWFNTD